MTVLTVADLYEGLTITKNTVQFAIQTQLTQHPPAKR